MRVLHIVKTSDGARWAAEQVKVLVQLGIQVYVALPSAEGEAIRYWRRSGASLHFVNCSLPIGSPWKFKQRVKEICELVEMIQPDLIHSHFVTTTLMLRLALGRNHSIPRIFQVPGPLHLEYPVYRSIELATSGESDYWIASSRYIRNLYLQNGISSQRVFLSYYGMDFEGLSANTSEDFRKRFGIPAGYHIVGNISYMYPPKYFLGHFTGLKRHEDIIKAISIVCKKRKDVIGVLVGGQWGRGQRYERKLQKLAKRLASDRIIFTGRLSHSEAINALRNFDLVVHVPISENCGGVVESLLFGVPTIASSVGGLPEVIIDGMTGWLVPPCAPKALAEAVLYVLDNYEEGLRRARLGAQLVRIMFDVQRTAKEVVAIYEHICNPSKPINEEFDSGRFVKEIAELGMAQSASPSRFGVQSYKAT